MRARSESGWVHCAHKIIALLAVFASCAITDQIFATSLRCPYCLPDVLTNHQRACSSRIPYRRMRGSFQKYFGRINGNMVLFGTPNLRFAFVIHIRTAPLPFLYWIGSRSSPSRGKPLTTSLGRLPSR
jgi:hypothetical protein